MQPTEGPSKKRNMIILATILIILIVLGMIYLSLQVRQKLVEVKTEKPLNLLLIGMDKNILTPGSLDNPEAVTRTDTLILAMLDPGNRKVSMLSIPRDSLVRIPDHGVNRINEASVLGGIPLTRRMVTRLTGVRIDHYMIVNFESFKQLVDLVGGIEVDVDKRMRYANEYGVYKIKLDPGLQLLDGEKALQYVRFRNEPLGDISRVERQRKLLLALYKKLKAPVNIIKVPTMMGIARKYMKTDLSSKQLLELISFARELHPERDIRSYTLPGSFYEAYWKPDGPKIRELIAELKPAPAVKKVITTGDK